MVRDYRIGALWIGGNLSYLEQLCLKSFIDVGQHVVLYTYEGITNAPEGVEIRDAAEILPLNGFLRHGRTGSPAPHADLFRYHMLAKQHDMIWADTDAYCLRPFTTNNGHFYAWESDHGLANGVLGLPPDSETLRGLLDFTSDEYGIPPWFSAKEQDRLRALRDAGTPVHAADQPWGVWGPAALTHFLKATGEVKYALPSDALYPFRYRDRRQMLKPGVRLEDYVTEECFSIHFYGRRMRSRILSAEPGGVPRPRSVIGRLLKAHGIDPAAAPLRRPEGDAPPAENAAEAETSWPPLWWPEAGQRSVASVADVTGVAVPELFDLWQQFRCDITLLSPGAEGPFTGAGPAKSARRELIARGVPREKIQIPAQPGDLRPVDLVLNIAGFGARWKRPLPESLSRSLCHSDTLMLSDIRKGSGAWGWLKALGPTEALGPPQGEMTRVQTRIAPPADQAGWAGLARELAGSGGFFEDLGEHSFLYIPRSPKVLVVTFDNLDIAMNKREDRRPWGFDFIEKQGWAMLGVMAGGWTWYRDGAVSAMFERLRDEGFFSRFERVVFYGASMGGYAAAAFSGAAPGADVVAISPQSTLDRGLVPWESRYKTAWHRDFSGPFGDAAEVSDKAARMVLLYDPFEPLDARHAARFSGDNVMRLPAPLMGHRLGSSLLQMGVLTEIILAALDGTLTPQAFRTTLRARRSFPRYQRELFEKAMAKGHRKLALRMAERALQLTDNRPLRVALRRARREGGGGSA
ncbi:glycosyltransferase family 32 protein [Falsigemmobacter faecalis]|uniref:hypothetical protein n=1 Tax=Falsigemmobacter faecalis TaxID=2488730 RepID=UPI0018F374C0|nr:hypothetical protein [Falsigemmobacter faecalis]